MQDVMIDLETMGNGPDAAIIAIGAVQFDIQNPAIGQTFYSVVDLKSAVMMGGVMDTDTVLWWMKQSDDARKALAKPGEPITHVLLSFSTWLQTHAGEDVRIWGNGSDFDNVILASTYRRVDLPLPWKFWNNRCYRTVKAMYPNVRMRRTGTHHNALGDAQTQARHLMTMLAGAEAIA